MGIETIAIIGIGLSVVGQVVQMQAQKSAQKKAAARAREAAELQRKAQEKQQKVEDLRALRARRAAVREAQIKRAETISAGERQGASGSSAVQGGAGSVTSQLGANLSFLDQTQLLTKQAGVLFGQAQEVANRPIKTSNFGSIISAVGGLTLQGASLVGSTPSPSNAKALAAGGTPVQTGGFKLGPFDTRTFSGTF